jgi:nitrogen fixation protein NifU and related proteins
MQFYPRRKFYRVSDLYSEILLDHYHLPRNKGELEGETLSVEGANPLCGDEITLHLKFDGETLTGISFTGKGCAISLASTSMLTEALEGKTISEIETWIANFRDFIRLGVEPAGADLGDIASLAGIAKLPVRVKCATLPWSTMKEAIARYRGT